MTRPYAFTFWQSAGHTPGYIEMCLESQRRNLADAFTHVHLDLDSAREWVPEHELLWEMSVPAQGGRSASLDTRRLAIFTGMLRAALLRRHGGLWVDADTLLFPRFALLAPLVEELDLVCGESASGGLGNAVLGGRPGSPFFERYLAAILGRIEEKRAAGDLTAVWGEFGFHMVRSVFLELDPARSWVAPWGVLNSVDPVTSRPTFEEGTTIASSLSPLALDVSVFSNGVDDGDRELGVQELRERPTLFAEAWRVATGEEDPAHLAIRDLDQLRGLDRAALMHRAARAEDERARTAQRALRGRLRALRAELREARAGGSAPSPGDRVRGLVRRVRR